MSRGRWNIVGADGVGLAGSVAPMVFEIIETANSEENLASKIHAFRQQASAFIAIDDFGCAHSNALRLLNISPEILKIDSFFIRAIHKAPATKREFLANILMVWARMPRPLARPR